MIPIHELRIQLPSPSSANERRAETMAPRASDSDAARAISGEPEPLMRIALFEESHHVLLHEHYASVFNPYEFCLEHREIPGEDQLNPWLRHSDTIVCDALVQKTGSIPYIREPSDYWWRRIEEKHAKQVWPGDAFLVRTDRREYEYFTEPPRQLPADWMPCPGSAKEQRDERMRALQTLDKTRAKASCVVVYDYLTVYTTKGKWRRKMVAYEHGSPSPFHFEYYDARAH